MAIPVYTNKRVGQSKEVNIPLRKDLSSGIDLSFQKDTLNALSKIEKDKSESEGISQYLSFKEDASLKVAELTKLNGANADDLESKYDEWKDEYISNIEFKDGLSEKAFFDRETIESSNNRITVGKYEVAEGIEYNNQVLEAEANSYALDATQYLNSPLPNIIGFSTKMAQAEAAYAEINAGKPEELIKQEFAITRDKTLTSITQQQVNNGEAKKAFTIINNAERIEALSPSAASSFIELNKSNLSKETATDIYNVTVDSFSFYTKGEEADMKGATIPDEERGEQSLLPRSLNDAVNMANNSLSDFKYNGDQYISNDPRYNEMVAENLQKQKTNYAESILKAKKAEISKFDDQINNQIFSWRLNPNDEAYAQIIENIEVLEREYGEYAIGGKLRKELVSQTETDVIKYGQVYANTMSGKYKDNYEYLKMDKLSLSDINNLKKLNKNKEEANFKKSIETVEVYVKGALGIGDKKDKDLTYEERIKFDNAKRDMTMMLSESYDGNLTSVEQLKEVAIAAAKSSEAYTKDVDIFLKDTLYDPKNSANKKFIKAYGLTKKDFTDFARDATLKYDIKDQTQLLHILKIQQDMKAKSDIFGEDVKESVYDPNYLTKSMTKRRIKEYREGINWYEEVQKGGL